MYFETAHNGRLRSSKVVDFGTNRKRVCDFLLGINSNLGPILPRFSNFSNDGVLYNLGGLSKRGFGPALSV